MAGLYDTLIRGTACPVLDSFHFVPGRALGHEGDRGVREGRVLDRLEQPFVLKCKPKDSISTVQIQFIGDVGAMIFDGLQAY